MKIGLGFSLSELGGYRPGVVTPGVWQPTDLTELKAWWSADDHGTVRMTDDGLGVISSWTDRVGGMAVTATTTARPTWSAAAFNSAYAGLTFDGTANCFVSTVLTTLPTGAVAGEIWGLVDNDALASDATSRTVAAYGVSGGATGRVLFRDVSAGVNRVRAGDQVGAGATSSGVDFSNPAIARGTYSGTTVGVSANGGTEVTAVISTLNTSTTRLRIGAGIAAGATGFFKGVCRHVMILTTLSASNRQRLEGWLAWDSGITSVLSSTHPYRFIAP